MKIGTVTIVLVLGSLMAGCSNDSETNPALNSGNTTPDIVQISDLVRYALPNFRLAGTNLECDSGQELSGCYISENCVAEDGDSRLYILDITDDRLLKGAFLFYPDTADCSGVPIYVGLSALNMEFTLGDTIMGDGDTAFSVVEMDALRRVRVGRTEFVTNYFSSYHLDDGRLCWPEADYGWSVDESTLFFQEELVSNRATDIDFDTCLLKIND